MCITQGLDLVEFRSTTSFEHFREAGPPLAKLVDYKKLRDERRREHQAAVERGRAAAGEGPALADDGSQIGGQDARRQDSLQELHAAMEKGKQAGRAATGLKADQESSTGAASSSGLQEDRQESRAEALGHVGRQFQNHGSEASSLESTTAQMGNSSSSERDTGGRDRKGEPELGSRQAKKQRQQERQQQRGPAKKEKVKELFFGTKIAKHDIEVRLKKARQWLSDGLKVSIAQEIDSIDSKSAAELALDTYIAKLADHGHPATAKHSTKSMVSVVLLPKAPANGLTAEAAVSQGSKKGKK
uniref:Translation initiation factor 3 N-terminal domain-containing protein n=1 Tax=Dunaliella tertiolecta TaxID=3047 RepID=A0A7S3VLZ2_DUNTE